MPEAIIVCSRISDADERVSCYDTAVAIAVAETTARGETLVDLSGRNDGDSEPFRANERWYVTWANQGSIITVELHTTSGAFNAVIATQIGSGSGRSRSFAAGDYRLAVRGVGAWDVQAVLE